MIVDFNRDSSGGQMLPSERKALYESIIESKPNIVCEVGTWRGGGSTYFITSAIYNNGFGKLYSAEIDESEYRLAKHLYNGTLGYLSPYVDLYLGNSLVVFPPLLKSFDKLVDFLMLDGLEDAVQTVKEYEMFQPYLAARARIACHDWNIDKMKRLRKILVNCRKLVEISDTPTGFAIVETSN